jgi:hypothetical protein
MHCLMLLSSQRWFCALSGSARERTSEFRDAHKVKTNTYGAEQPSDTIVASQSPGEAPSPSPSIHSASNPGCPAVGVHSFEGTAAPRFLSTPCGVAHIEAATFARLSCTRSQCPLRTRTK